jgi:hypothetical protein
MHRRRMHASGIVLHLGELYGDVLAGIAASELKVVELDGRIEDDRVGKQGARPPVEGMLERVFQQKPELPFVISASDSRAKERKAIGGPWRSRRQPRKRQQTKTEASPVHAILPDNMLATMQGREDGTQVNLQ